MTTDLIFYLSVVIPVFTTINILYIIFFKKMKRKTKKKR